MDKLESLIAEANYEIEYKYDMPDQLGGLCCGKTIFLNANKPKHEQLQDLAEEIGHQETSVGDIINQSYLENRKQELKARRIAYSKLIPLNELVTNYWKATNEYELADLLDITPKFLSDAINYYRDKYGSIIIQGDYLINLANGIQILKA